ncbi:MAG: GTPase [Candidatus Riflebacteria bacterium]|nr:GTPase [Candidatus Riflebacteria bacterium]
MAETKRRVVIIGAAGRDFQNFNVLFKHDASREVVAFTATQIPGIANRSYPASLAGALYPKGVPIWDEKDLERLIREERVDECYLSYSDLSYETVMHLGSRVMAAGATFSMLGARQTWLSSTKPVIAVVAVRTGCGKSQTTRRVVEILREADKHVVVVRHPMPYGNLEAQNVQRYQSLADLERHQCTIEEMEEYEPHIVRGSVVFAGVDYEAILREAEKEADVVVWDGGNNDTPFYRPDLTITVADPLRPGHELGYYPGEVNFRMADVIVVNKVDSAEPAAIQTVVDNARKVNPTARVIKAESVLTIDDPRVIAGKHVLVIEDGPTLTHGEMKLGAGIIAARRAAAASLVKPQPFTIGGIRAAYEKYPHMQDLLPALGYGQEQMKELEETIARIPCDSVVVATPIDLARFIRIDKPHTRVKYDLSASAKEELRALLKERKLV